MKGEAEKILTFAASLQTATNTAQLIANFGALVKSLGLEHFVMTGLPWDGWDFQSLVVGTNFPDEWRERYIIGEYLRDDSVAWAAVSSIAPFSWQKAQERFGHSDRSQQIASESSAFGLVDGIAFPHLDLHNRQAIASLVMDRTVDIAPDLVVILQGVIPMVYNRYWELAGGRQVATTPLSPRETEIIKWISVGKTAWEISRILSVSEATVRFHLRSARSKLGTTSLSHTVASAILNRHI